MVNRFLFVGVLVIFSSGNAYTTQRPGNDDSNPFLDMASSFLSDALANQNGGGGGGIGGIASMLGNLMQPDNGAGKSDNGAAAILSGIGSLIANANGGGGGGGFDPSMIGNVISMFAQTNDNDQPRKKKRNAGNEGPGWETMLSLASTFMSNYNSQSNDDEDHGSRKQAPSGGNDALSSLLPVVLQAINSFSGPEMEKTQQKHKDHAWVLPPFLENIHVMWDHFSNSELAEALWSKVGLNTVFKGFVGRDGKLDYNKLFDTLGNQSFRRRWIKSAIIYMSDWANYIANPEVYQRYVATGQMMANGFLQAQGYPKQTHLDINRPSETISNLIDHVAKKHLNVKIASVTYVKPAVNYVKELLKLGKARGLLQQLNATELSDKLTDTLNLEVIEPVLKVHRAYRHAIQTPHCDKYVLCEINSHDLNEKLGLGGFKHGVTKFGSMAAAWFVSHETKTPFWTLFAIINDPYNCDVKHPVDCTDFHEDEAKVTTEYTHNEL